VQVCGMKDPPRDAASDPATWLDRHGDALFRYALLRVREPDLAEEMVQECLLAALGARARFSGQSSERTWLVGILKRKIIDHARRVARERPAEAVDPAESIEQAVFDDRGFWKKSPVPWGGDPHKLAEDREFWDVLRRCLANLSPRLAEAFLLRELDRMSSDEVCQVLDVSPTNLWARLHRARLGLRRCLEENWFARRRKR
jgi:RNA polymerase sigma-70 factor (TIGR02943 family)